MISSRIELIARRRLINAFIQADGVVISFTRPGSRVKGPAGGYTRGPEQNLAAQNAAIIPSKRRYDTGLVNSEAGLIPVSEYYILGRHTLDVQVDDEFVWQGKDYVVRSIHPVRSDPADASTAESILAVIEMRGEDNV